MKCGPHFETVDPVPQTRRQMMALAAAQAVANCAAAMPSAPPSPPPSPNADEVQSSEDSSSSQQSRRCQQSSAATASVAAAPLTSAKAAKGGTSMKRSRHPRTSQTWFTQRCENIEIIGAVQRPDWSEAWL